MNGLKLHRKAEDEVRDDVVPGPAGRRSPFSIVPAIDAAIERFYPRHTVSGTDVVDMLLEMRLVAELQESVSGEATTAR